MRIKNGRMLQLRVPVRISAIRDYPKHTHIRVDHYRMELDKGGYVPDRPYWIRVVTLSDDLVMHVRHDEVMKLGTRVRREHRRARGKSPRVCSE